MLPAMKATDAAKATPAALPDFCLRDSQMPMPRSASSHGDTMNRPSEWNQRSLTGDSSCTA